MTCHQELLLDLNADCAEFCTSHENSNWLAVGTYQLDESTRTRDGRLYLYSLVQQKQLQQQRHQLHPQLQPLATLNVPGIFDLQWSQPHMIHTNPCMGLALADGSLRLVAVQQDAHSQQGQQQQQQRRNSTESNDAAQDAQQDQEEHHGSTTLQEVCSCQAVEGMALALDWCVSSNNMQQQHFAAVSSSNGTIGVLQVQDAGLQQLCGWKGHELEAWMAHWDKHQPYVLYSGADDCTFKGWDTRTALSSSSSSSSSDLAAPQQTPIFTNRKAHSAGVCCISSHPRKEHVLVTGSYDEYARLWDVRVPNRPIESCQVSTGGGVWRLKWHPQHDGLLLAACMYQGFALIAADAAWSSLHVTETYKGHDSIAYGADWHRGNLHGSTSAEHSPADMCASAARPSGSAQLAGAALHDTHRQQDFIATCSFYDRRLHLWSPNTA